jgi:hypothetical protein
MEGSPRDRLYILPTINPAARILTRKILGTVTSLSYEGHAFSEAAERRSNARSTVEERRFSAA